MIGRDHCKKMDNYLSCIDGKEVMKDIFEFHNITRYLFLLCKISFVIILCWARAGKPPQHPAPGYQCPVLGAGTGLVGSAQNHHAQAP